MHKHIFLQRLLLLAVLAAFSFSCKSSPTGPHIGQNLQLSSDYVTCTEVWLKIAYSGQRSAVSGGEFKITRDGDAFLTGNLASPDTTVIDTTAQPYRTYTYKAYWYVRTQVSDTSLPLQVTTMDTTSNNFTWQTYTFGGNAGGCILYAVAIITDTEIWAVGAIPVKDSSANGFSVYNLVKWDGHKWSLDQVMFPLCDPNGNQQNLQPFGCYGVLAFSDSDIWLSSGVSLVHWQAGTVEPLCFSIGYGARTLGRMLGVDGGLYIVGTNGFAAYNDGYVWQQLSTGTSLDIQDVWGIPSATTGDQEVVAVASDQLTNNGVAVLELSGTQVTSLQTAGLPGTSIVGVWSAMGKEWYVCGDGIYKSRDLSEPWQEVKGIPPIYSEAIKGIGPNDIFVVGDFGLVLHWNGVSWHDYSGNELPYNPGSYLAVAEKGNTVVAVGYYGGTAGNQPAVVVIGKRN